MRKTPLDLEYLATNGNFADAANMVSFTGVRRFDEDTGASMPIKAHESMTQSSLDSTNATSHFFRVKVELP